MSSKVLYITYRGRIVTLHEPPNSFRRLWSGTVGDYSCHVHLEKSEWISPETPDSEFAHTALRALVHSNNLQLPITGLRLGKRVKHTLKTMWSGELSNKPPTGIAYEVWSEKTNTLTGYVFTTVRDNGTYLILQAGDIDTILIDPDNYQPTLMMKNSVRYGLIAFYIAPAKVG